jgi:hypothetical protein
MLYTFIVTGDDDALGHYTTGTCVVPINSIVESGDNYVISWAGNTHLPASLGTQYLICSYYFDITDFFFARGTLAAINALNPSDENGNVEGAFLIVDGDESVEF